MKRISTQLMLITMLMLCGCGGAAEKKIRGIPAGLWQHLTAEQKQIIIDRSYEDEFGKK